MSNTPILPQQAPSLLGRKESLQERVSRTQAPTHSKQIAKRAVTFVRKAGQALADDNHIAAAVWDEAANALRPLMDEADWRYHVEPELERVWLAHECWS